MGVMAVWMLLWALVGIAILVLAVVGMLWLVRRKGTDRVTSGGLTESADELLRRRYAAGAIEEDEFYRRQSSLT